MRFSLTAAVMAGAVLLTASSAVAQAPRLPPPLRGLTPPPQPMRPPVEVPAGDFVWTWGEPSPEAEEGAKREPVEGLLVVRVEGQQRSHACVLTAELMDFLDPGSEKVREAKDRLERLRQELDFALRVKAYIERTAGVVYGARLSCVVAPTAEEQRARERAREAQERRRSR